MNRFITLILLLSFIPSSFAITPEEALDSLYARMSLPDSLDYSREFFAENVRMSLKARQEMPWGKEINDTLFYDFVLPVRTNNERLDSSRTVFYEELAPRVKNMSIGDAALEVNHWAHEKATYKPSDARTSSPLATVKTSWGRCGEESAFVVAAMRAVGIPSRQVYTPRWAHTDDNHAWVEVYVDDRWQFLGACEPEAELNMAWFTAPASRGMLMSTRTDGRYIGKEEILFTSPSFTLVNVTPNYAATAKARVKALKPDGSPAVGARVMYCLYNYAEFYPVATQTADSLGTASVTTGLGDIVIWATDGNHFGIGKMTVGKDEDYTITLDHITGDNFAVDFDIIPPSQSASLPQASEEAVAANERRKAYEDSIRNAYMATMFDAAEARTYADRYEYDPDIMARILPATYGNHPVICRFLSYASKLSPQRATDLLGALSEKDLRDVSYDVLLDNYLHTPRTGDTLMYASYVLNPRVSNEELYPYKKFFNKLLSAAQKTEFKADPSALVRFINDSISVSDDRNPRRLPISPVSVWRHKRDIDSRSRDILFVAIARSCGIPARIDPVSGAVEYSADKKTWTAVNFERNRTQAVDKVNLHIRYLTKGARIADPKYYSNFSICRIDDGVPHQLAYDDFTPWSKSFKNGTMVDPGYYMLVTGQRRADGGVLARAVFFDAHKPMVPVPMIIRNDSTSVEVIGSFNSENKFHDISTDSERSILSATGRGYYVLGLIAPGHEPSVHALNDIVAVADELDEMGIGIVLLFADADQASRFRTPDSGRLPKNTVLGYDSTGAIAKELTENLRADTADKPVFIIADTFNRVVYFNQGYTIQLGEKIAGILKRVNE
ncbi:MAG: transglutaminase domain-containing protein [Muribaculaceae bacterium]|nr:transglutaminase domain-containing protein [Muribaculaceae bacterium]